MADTTYRHKDSTERVDSQPFNALDSVDRNKLLADKRTPIHPGVLSEKGLPANGHLNDELRKTDIYATKDQPAAAPPVPQVERYKLDKHELSREPDVRAEVAPQGERHPRRLRIQCLTK